MENMEKAGEILANLHKEIAKMIKPEYLLWKSINLIEKVFRRT